MGSEMCIRDRFDGVFMEKILITVLNTHGGGSCASIAEIQFKIDQTACFGIVDACGICDGPGIITWYQDNDNDGLGNPSVSIDACIQPAGYVEDNTDACDTGDTWADMVVLFQDNGCMGCHGAAASGGLDLRTYATASAGGNICGTNLLSGTTLVDIMTVSGYSGCGTPIPIPSMNDRTGGQFDATELAELQAWIDAGASELCAPACATLDLDIRFDGFPFQTSWDIQDDNGMVVASGGSYSSSMSNTLTTENACLPDGCYTLNFYDVLSNGMCPFRATASSGGIFVTPGTIISPGSTVATLGTVVTPGLCGNYHLYDASGTLLVSGGGGFGASETNSFCLSGGISSFNSQGGNIQSKITDNDAQLRIIPNIVDDQTMLYYSLETDETIHIQITDVTGKIIQQYERNFNDSNEIQINTNHLESGFYYAQLVSGKVMLTEKFVKMN